MFILLVGPKGSGKSHVGRVLERRLGVRFFHVEPLWMEYHAQCRAAGRMPEIAGGIGRIHPQIAAALREHPLLCVETTGASAEILADLLRLAPRNRTLIVRVQAPLELCVARVQTRDQTHQIAMDLDGVRKVHEISSALALGADLTLDNGALTDDAIAAAVRAALERRGLAASAAQ